MHKTHSRSTHGTYQCGSGITITRANIKDEQQRRAYNGQSPASPEQIVCTFATVSQQNDIKRFQQTARYTKLVARASAIMSNA